MNNLSIFVYLAGLSENASSLLVIFGIVGIIAIGLAALFHKADPDALPAPKMWALYACLAATALGAALPSSNTVYMIAASEKGADAMASEYGQEVMQEAKRALIETIRGLSPEVSQ